MTVIEINKTNYLSLVDYPTGPNERFFANQLPIQNKQVYEPIISKCEKCGFEIEFKEHNFQKHSNSFFSNLNDKDKTLLEKYKQAQKLDKLSYLDFYCPSCKQPTQILYEDGYGGKSDYLISIKSVLVIK